MKITDPDVIKNGEKDLIESVQRDLDPGAVKEIIQKRMAGAVLSSRGGEIIVHNNEIAFRLDFDVHLSGSLMFDRQGNYIPASDETDDLENFISGDLEPNDLEPDDLEPDDLELDDLGLDGLELDDLDQLPQDSGSAPENQTDDLILDDLADDDMNDILKESRDFWDQKKES